LCGPKDGEYIYKCPFLYCLDVGETDATIAAFNEVREKWKAAKNVAN
jgi:hypothetical protein